MSSVYTGGCQCGKIRFRIEGRFSYVSVCHCRMCQKAFGAFYAPLANIGDSLLTWTRGELAHFQSSNYVRRGFCRDCGTPLTYEAPDEIAIAIGAFDRPEAVKPNIQYGVEGRIPWEPSLSQLPERPTSDEAQNAPFLCDLVSYQHPDHETETWPPDERSDKS